MFEVAKLQLLTGLTKWYILFFNIYYIKYCFGDLGRLYCYSGVYLCVLWFYFIIFVPSIEVNWI